MEGRRPDELWQMRHESHVATTYVAFLKDLRWLGKMSEQEAQKAAVSVLHALEQRIVRSQARHLEAQLPSKLRELLHEAEGAEGEEFKRFGKQRLFRMVARDLGKEPSDVEPAVRAVFAAVRMHISEGEAEHVASGLPEDLAELWRHPR